MFSFQLINELDFLLEDTPKEQLSDRDKAMYTQVCKYVFLTCASMVYDKRVGLKVTQ